jgi:hypothetical protein
VARGETTGAGMGSVLLPTLRLKSEVDAAIRDTLDKVLVLRFGRATDATCLHLDDIVSALSRIPQPLHEGYCCAERSSDLSSPSTNLMLSSPLATVLIAWVRCAILN